MSVGKFRKIPVQEMIRNEDFWRNTALQHCSDIASNCHTRICPKIVTGHCKNPKGAGEDENLS